MVRVHPERFVAGGEALARDDDGRVLFVRGAVPGDDVSVTITEEHGDWSRGVVDTIHVASADRVEPPCVQRREGCGGCDWQHVADSVQLPAKVAIVVDALRRTGKLPDADVRAAGSVPVRRLSHDDPGGRRRRWPGGVQDGAFERHGRPLRDAWSPIRRWSTCSIDSSCRPVSR